MIAAPTDSQWQAGVPFLTVDLTYSPNAKPMSGGSKQALFATCSEVLPGFTSPNVVIKQVFREVDQGNGTSRRLLLPSDGQIRYLTAEILCGQWADALMKDVFDFIEAQIKATEVSKEQLPIPNIRYVRMALALEDGVRGDHRKVFLIEERIDKSTEGGWRKYMNNNMAVPNPTATRTCEEQHIADFLVFCQHAQYKHTSELAYVTDYQGASSPRSTHIWVGH